MPAASSKIRPSNLRFNDGDITPAKLGPHGHRVFLETVIQAGIRTESGFRPVDTLREFKLFVRGWKVHPADGKFEFWSQYGEDPPIWHWAFWNVSWEAIETGRWGGLHGTARFVDGECARFEKVEAVA